ncbi:hypothetical protein HYT55_04350 [Candidatus Woesearchaeota archaeon]|nr:hypothetical protein [Candidatus Woesearchaeota archaeon]
MMRKIMLVFFFALIVAVVVGCQRGVGDESGDEASALAGMAVSSEVGDCKKATACQALYNQCSNEKACRTTYTSSQNSCKSLAGSVKTDCLKAAIKVYSECLNGCYDSAIATWKESKTGPSSFLSAVKWGDINNDGKVSSTDLQCYALASQNSSAPCRKQSLADADLNCDNIITAADQAIVANIMTGGSLPQDVNVNGIPDCKEKNVKPIGSTCTDSDSSGAVPKTSVFNQSVYTTGNVLANGTVTFDDYCSNGYWWDKSVSGTKVYEWYCDAVAGNSLEGYDCSKDGATCQNGACVKKQPQCPAWMTTAGENQWEIICTQNPVSPDNTPGSWSEKWHAARVKYDKDCKLSGLDYNKTCGDTANSCSTEKGCIDLSSGFACFSSNSGMNSTGLFDNSGNTAKSCVVPKMYETLGLDEYTSTWQCRTDNTTFAGCMPLSQYEGRCKEAGTCSK